VASQWGSFAGAGPDGLRATELRASTDSGSADVAVAARRLRLEPGIGATLALPIPWLD